MQCHRCNERLPLSARACFSCGAPVEREAVAHTAPESPALPARMRVTMDGAPLRDRPFASARTVLLLRQDQIVTVNSEQWGFAQTETAEGRRGFVDRAAVAPLTTSPPPAGTPRATAG